MSTACLVAGKPRYFESGLGNSELWPVLDGRTLRDGDDVVPNEGLVKRSQHTNQSRVVDMMGRLHADIFFLDRYMLNEVNVKIKFVRSKDAFCVMSEADCRVVITKATMFVRKVKLSVFLAHAKALENGTAKYPIRRVNMQDVYRAEWFSRHQPR